jgi:hypothetical protein
VPVERRVYVKGKSAAISPSGAKQSLAKGRFLEKDANPNSLSASSLPSRASGRALHAEALCHVGSKEREVLDPGFEESGIPSKASSAKVK